jgi:ParB family chromosome partitioning protein
MRKFLEVPLASIDEPTLPMRENMDDGKLLELQHSIERLGVLQPIRLRPKGDGRFEVVSGHRRLLASRAAGLASIPAVLHADDATLIAARVAENVVREDVPPAEEAVYYAQLYEAHGKDVDAIATLVGRSRAYVEERLLLLQGDPVVLEALGRSEISLGVAQELNRFKVEADRRYHLEYAVRTGCSVRQMRDWRNQANTRAELAAAAPAPLGPDGTPVPAPGPTTAHGSYAAMAKPFELSASTEMRNCLFCDEPRPEYKMFRKYICEACAEKHLVPIEQRRGG